MVVPTLAYSVDAELSYLGFREAGNSNTAQPYPNMLINCIDLLILREAVCSSYKGEKPQSKCEHIGNGVVM